MLAIITGTISPDKNIDELFLSDVEERLKQYKESLEFLIDSSAFDKIVFCDNSNWDIQVFVKLKDKAKNKGIQLELLSFNGKKEQILAHGKGYGEGEIMSYVFRNSSLVVNEEFFVKITGRLKIYNIQKITKLLKKNKTYFNIPNHTRRNMYDTRFYAMPSKQFRDCFLEKYVDVIDAQGVFLEHVYTSIIKEKEIKISNFPKYPRIRGVSGSTGNIYEFTEWKCRIKDICSYLGLYKIKE